VGRGRAALLVAGLALATAAPERAPRWTPCAAPVGDAARGALASVACDGRPGEPLAGAVRLVFALPLDLNHADATALDALPGIGAGRAAAIVRARRERPFCRVEELDRVPGIGLATIARLAPLLAAGRAPGCAGS